VAEWSVGLAMRGSGNFWWTFQIIRVVVGASRAIARLPEPSRIPRKPPLSGRRRRRGA
jgi:hypothetical protein